jgi:Cu(I)/Ag(I) efflux system protein CusF
MKTAITLSLILLLAACSAPQDDAETAKPEAATAPSQPAVPAEPAPPATPMDDMPAGATMASASGKVEAVDPAAGTVTIAHGAIDALKWPAMTMTFKAGNVDISGLKAGDQVDLEFTSTGMDGTLTKISAK